MPTDKHTPTPYRIRDEAYLMLGDRPLIDAGEVGVSSSFKHVAVVSNSANYVSMTTRRREQHEESLATARFIVKACNAHEQLVAALKRAKGCINGLLKQTPVRDVAETLAEIDAALSTVETK